MSVRIPDAVRSAAAASRGPVLLYDLAAIAARLAAVRAAAAAAGVEVVAAVKALGVPDIAAAAAAALDGLDLAGPDEDRAVGPAVGLVSVTYPGGATAARLAALVRPGRRVVVTCETPAQVAAAATVVGVEILARVSTSALGELAPGGIRDAAGGHASRFGVDRDQLRALCAAAPGRIRGLHLHGGPLAVSPARRAARAAAALALADAAGVAVARLDLGGALHGFALAAPAAGQATLAAALAAVRAVVPASVELCVEPGRALTEGCGYAAGQVLAARAVAGHEARVLELSRLCHLRWSTPVLGGAPVAAGAGRRVVLLGATCCEDDVIGDPVVADDDVVAVGTRLVLASVSSYAAAWNHGFAGVPPAQVVVV
ncbi:MAG: hypothetical protein R3B06_11860 [Kofleriaceae bacterium]